MLAKVPEDVFPDPPTIGKFELIFPFSSKVEKLAGQLASSGAGGVSEANSNKVLKEIVNEIKAIEKKLGIL